MQLIVAIILAIGSTITAWISSKHLFAYLQRLRFRTNSRSVKFVLTGLGNKTLITVVVTIIISMLVSIGIAIFSQNRFYPLYFMLIVIIWAAYGFVGILDTFLQNYNKLTQSFSSARGRILTILEYLCYTMIIFVMTDSFFGSLFSLHDTYEKLSGESSFILEGNPSQLHYIWYAFQLHLQFPELHAPKHGTWVSVLLALHGLTNKAIEVLFIGLYANTFYNVITSSLKKEESP